MINMKKLYIHNLNINDLIKTVEACSDKPGVHIFNLGTGNGYTVFELINNFEKANGIKVPYVVEGRRAGDVAQCYADTALAKELLGWEAKLGVFEMCRDSWKGANI
jgi:UDP-glucose 4-epimerase